MVRYSLLVVAVCLSACSSGTRVMLLPQENGSASSVIVSSEKDKQTLSKPYARASMRHDNTLDLDASSPEEVQKLYPQLLAKLPPKPNKYVLNFLPGGIELTPESVALLPTILEDASTRAGADLVVTGHTDTTGDLLANDALSLKRAELVSKLLILSGAPQNRVEAVGRGKRELLVKTADNVDEPKNRRVEIIVR